MISNLSRSLRLTIVFCLFFSVFYIFVLWSFAQVARPNKGDAELVTSNGKVVGTTNVGRNFTQDIYLWGRPFYVGDGYDASSLASGSKGPSNEEHSALSEEYIDAFLVHHPYLTHEKVSTKIITASSPGLDPHIPPKVAYAQTKRVVDARGWSEEGVMGIVNSHIEKPLLGMFETEKVSVLKLNVALGQALNNR